MTDYDRERKRMWRVGTRVPVNLYRDDVIAGQCQSAEIAAEIVAGTQQAARVRELEIQVANLTPEKCPDYGKEFWRCYERPAVANAANT